jgi:S1-C subfamily serine protease
MALAIGALVAIMLLVLAGCGSSIASNNTATASNTGAAVPATSNSKATVTPVTSSDLVPTDGSLASPAEKSAAIVGPSVVNIAVVGGGSQGVQQYSATGSGVIITSDGMIVTNNHVVSESNVEVSSITVTLATGEKLPGTIVGRDPLTDLAVVKINKSGLTPATFVPNIDQVKVGQYAIAIGSPLGYKNSVTLGIVSGLQRDLADQVTTAADAQAYVDLIQTDAAISPGNSGGALANAAGQIMGINVAYLPPQATGAENVGFAIPADVVQDTVKQLIASGTVQHAYAGVSLQTVTKDLQTQFGLSRDTGVLVAEVGQGTPAEQAGLQQGDIITSVDGKTVSADVDVSTIFRSHKPGDTVSVTFDRNGQQQTVKLVLGTRPAA